MNKDCLILNIAGFFFRINFKKTEWQFALNKLRNEIIDYLAGFMVDNKAKFDYTINIEEQTTLLLNKKSPGKYFLNFFNKNKKRSITTFYQIGFLQFQTILREAIIELLSDDQGFILHGSAVGNNEGAYVFTGKNGAGKSTAMTLLNKKYLALADDTVIIKKEKDGYFLYQTPFIEKNYWVKKTGRKYLLKAVFFVKKSTDFKINDITDKQQILKKIINQFWTSEEFYKKQMKSLLDFVDNFNRFHYLYFAKDEDKLTKLLRKYEIQNQ